MPLLSGGQQQLLSNMHVGLGQSQFGYRIVWVTDKVSINQTSIVIFCGLSIALHHLKAVEDVNE